MRSRAPQRRRVVDGAEPEVALHRFRRREVAVPHARAADARVRHHVVEPVEEHRHPADPAFGERDVQAAGSAAGCAPTASRRWRRCRCTGNSVVLSSSGAPGVPARPRRRAGVQAHHRVGLLARREQRVPVVGVHRRQADVVRVLREAQRLEPARGVAPHVVGGDGRIVQPRDLQRDDALGVRCRPTPRGASRSTRARTPGRARGRWLRANIVPANPASNDGKHSDAQMPAMSMSAMRAWMSQQPLRISSKRTGSMLHSSFGRPITALRPMFGNSASSNAHAWLPSSSSTTRGARSASVRGHPAVEQVGAAR